MLVCVCVRVCICMSVCIYVKENIGITFQKCMVTT
jgi:hypothetical protein